MDVKKIGEFISKNRKLKGLTQEQLGEKLGVSNKTISRWENGNYMPDLSLLKPLSEELGITLNELLSGEKVEEKNVAESTEQSIINTIDYTSEKLEYEHKKIAMAIMILGAMLALASFIIFDAESSWSSIYSILGLIIFVFGVFKLLKNRALWKRIAISISLFVGIFGMFIVTDYVGVCNYKRPPMYRYKTEYSSEFSDMLVYYGPFYNVYRINKNTSNEYYIIDVKNEYTSENVPKTPFNREKSGIENIKKYQNKYMGNNSNTGNLVNSLPLSESGCTIEMDPEKLELTIDYLTTFWYHNENLYNEKSLIYNSVSIFALIENVQSIKYNFSGSSYTVSRQDIEEKYPNYSKIIENGKINTSEFNKNVEEKINDDYFVEEISKLILKK